MKFLALLFSVLLTLNAYANRCEADKRKFCHNLTGARGEIARCLTEHAHEITPDCAKELKEFKLNASKKNPCFQELADYCADVPNTQPNLNYCLMNNESRLGQRCLKDFTTKKNQMLKQDVCAKDIISVCYPDIKGPNGSITRCLIKQKMKLSKLCKEVTEQIVSKMKVTNPCFEDTEKYCPTQVRMPDIQECLEKKIKEIKPACRHVVQAEMDLARSNPCYKDVRKLCRPGVTPEEQNSCLELSYKEVSQACKDFRISEAQKIEKMRVSCEVDRLKYCKDAPFRDGLIVKCLQHNKAKLSNDCRKYF